MHSIDYQCNLRGTESLIRGREALLIEGQADLQTIIDVGFQTGERFGVLVAERALSRVEAYDWFVAGRRVQSAERNMSIGHMRFQYAPLDMIEDAISALHDKRTFAIQIEELPGIWNFPARREARGKLIDASRQLAACFRTDLHGMVPTGELEMIHEENVTDPLLKWLHDSQERERFVDDWQQFVQLRSIN